MGMVVGGPNLCKVNLGYHQVESASWVTDEDLDEGSVSGSSCTTLWSGNPTYWVVTLRHSVLPGETVPPPARSAHSPTITHQQGNELVPECRLDCGVTLEFNSNPSPCGPESAQPPDLIEPPTNAGHKRLTGGPLITCNP